MIPRARPRIVVDGGIDRTVRALRRPRARAPSRSRGRLSRDVGDPHADQKPAAPSRPRESRNRGGRGQGLYAIGSGGLFGRGLGKSVQKLGFLPEAQNDMIFSIICEELGLVGASLIILLFLILIWRFFVIATHAKDLTGALIATGAMAHMMIQVILNIAVVTNSIPNTGITLPFISYGGTSVVFLLLEMGLVLSVSNLVE